MAVSRRPLLVLWIGHRIAFGDLLAVNRVEDFSVMDGDVFWRFKHKKNAGHPFPENYSGGCPAFKLSGGTAVELLGVRYKQQL